MLVLLLHNKSCDVARLRSKEVEGYVTRLVKAMLFFFHACVVTAAAEKIMLMIRGKHERKGDIIALWHDAIFKL